MLQAIENKNKIDTEKVLKVFKRYKKEIF